MVGVKPQRVEESEPVRRAESRRADVVLQKRPVSSRYTHIRTRLYGRCCGGRGRRLHLLPRDRHGRVLWNVGDAGCAALPRRACGAQPRAPRRVAGVHCRLCRARRRQSRHLSRGRRRQRCKPGGPTNLTRAAPEACRLRVRAERTTQRRRRVFRRTARFAPVPLPGKPNGVCEMCSACSPPRAKTSRTTYENNVMRVLCGAAPPSRSLTVE